MQSKVSQFFSFSSSSVQPCFICREAKRLSQVIYHWGSATPINIWS